MIRPSSRDRAAGRAAWKMPLLPTLDGTARRVSNQTFHNARGATAMFLDHLIVPAKDRRSSAELLATVLGVRWSEEGVGPFCGVFVNDGLTLDFDQWDEALPVQHYCFRMSEAEFDQLLARLGRMGISYRSSPHGPPDLRINAYGGGRIVYWSEPDGHVWEALTVSYAREVQSKQGGAD